MANQVDLGEFIASGGTLTLGNEHPDDGQHRRQLEREAAAHARRVNLIVILFALIVVAVVLAGCAYYFAAGQPDDKKWAAGFIGSILSGLVGYLVGKR